MQRIVAAAVAVVVLIGGGAMYVANVDVERGGSWTVEAVDAGRDATSREGTIHALYYTTRSRRVSLDAVHIILGRRHLPPLANTRAFTHVETQRGDRSTYDSHAASLDVAWISANQIVGNFVDYDSEMIVSGYQRTQDSQYDALLGESARRELDGSVYIGDEGVIQVNIGDVDLVRRYTYATARPAVSTPSTVRGPSAGLSYGLYYVDYLDSLDIIGHCTVAATGAIAAGGFIHPVGHIEQKMRAAVALHADVVVVPDNNSYAARAALDRWGGEHIDLISVQSLVQAVHLVHAYTTQQKGCAGV